MTISRRDALMATLFGGSMIGLRSIATGLPAKMILDPKKALADLSDQQCLGDAGKAQFLIMQTSGSGDPFSCNAPGTYDYGGTVNTGTNYGALSHPSDAASGVAGIDPVAVAFGNGTFKAAGPWGTLPPAVLQQTCVFHLMTNTPVHPKEPQVLSLMGATPYNEMFPSLLAMQLAPCLGTLQTQPISVGAASPSEGLTFKGQALPTIPPTSLAATLTSSQATAFKGMTNLQSLRDQTLNDMNTWYKDSAQTSPAQKAYIDSMVTSQQQVRGIAQSQLSMLQGITKNDNSGQITAAVALILMKVTPVIAVHFPFGGDNHADPNLTAEATQTVSGMQAIVQLMAALSSAGLSDKVSFLSLNVFGRTMDVAKYTDGRNHNQDHECSIMIGKPFKSAVIGGMWPSNTKLLQGAADFGCMPIDSKTGLPNSSGDVAPVETLSSWAKTIMTGVGVSDDQITASITDTNAKVIAGALT
ncbi:MAG TPA: hypothetical protein VH054_06825 [Polyangiaceae bacterium]|nr:hypothetical protein [Polyangiaceae bacterium]